MPAAVDPRVALLRGASVGSLTATTAIAAHGAAGGGFPALPEIVAGVVVGALVGAPAAVVPALRRGSPALVAVLAAGQYLAHVALEATMAGRHQTMPGTTGSMDMASMGAASTSPLMITAHVVAVLACVVLVRCAECAVPAATGVLRRVLVTLGLLSTAPEPPHRSAVVDQTQVRSLRSQLLLLCCAPRRGPPAGALPLC